jgi:hypothetical protein
MASDNSLGKNYERSIDELKMLAEYEQKLNKQKAMMRQMIAPPYGNLQSAAAAMNVQAARPATLKEQLESIIAGRKSQLTVLEHLLATLNLGAFKSDPAAEKFYEHVIGQALSAVK